MTGQNPLDNFPYLEADAQFKPGTGRKRKHKHKLKAWFSPDASISIRRSNKRIQRSVQHKMRCTST